MTAVRSSVRCQILSAWLAGETRAETTKVLGVTEQLWPCTCAKTSIGVL